MRLAADVIWDKDLLEMRLVQAAEIMRTLPDREYGWLYRGVVLWPAVQAEAMDYAAYARLTDAEKATLQESMERKLRVRSSRLIDWEETTRTWISYAGRTQDRRLVGKVVWALSDPRYESTRIPWSRVKRLLRYGYVGLHNDTLKRYYDRGLWNIAKILNKKGISDLREKMLFGA